MKISLHLGAHKTASTYLQKTLEANRANLSSAAVYHIPMRQFRTSITANLGDPSPNFSERVAALLEPAANCDWVIISDENILGSCEIFEDPSYYHSAAGRVGKLIEAFRGHEVEVFIATRSYDSFVSSMYCEFIRHHPFVTPEEYLAAADVDGLSWFELIGDLSKIVGEDRLTYWRFEDFDKLEQIVLSRIARGGAIGRDSHGRVRESQSQAGIEVLKGLRWLIGRQRTRLFVGRVGRLLPKRRGFRAFRAFGAGDALALARRYESDLARLRSKYPALNFLDPVAEH